jgi:hypothetical protein
MTQATTSIRNHSSSSFIIISHHFVVVHDGCANFMTKALISTQLGCAGNNKHGSDLRGRLQENNQHDGGLDDSFGNASYP